MKRRDLLRHLTELGVEFIREGRSHAIYRNPRTGLLIPVPRHREVNDSLAAKIIRDASA